MEERQCRVIRVMRKDSNTYSGDAGKNLKEITPKQRP